jgi:hypothetical protein
MARLDFRYKFIIIYNDIKQNVDFLRYDECFSQFSNRVY